MAELPQIRQSAQDYARNAGLHLPDINYQNPIITETASRHLSNAYARLPEFDAGSIPAYHAMREETMRQYDHMTRPVSRGGLGVNVEVTKDDPYGQGGFEPVHNLFNELHHDVRDNNRIKVLSTKTTGGHPVFSDDENDAFRAVHDLYGHLGSGRGIDFDGEEAAFQKHSRMFSPLARQAMTTETRGQNSALRVHGSFQGQKVGVLPAHMQALQFSRTGTVADVEKAKSRAALKNREQGL